MSTWALRRASIRIASASDSAARPRSALSLVAATARVVTPDDADHVRLWKLVNSINHDRYDAYQAKTTRPIAMVVVER